MPKTVEFYDVKTKKKFRSDEYRVVPKGNRTFLVTKSPEGTHECWKSISKENAQKLM